MLRLLAAAAVATIAALSTASASDVMDKCLADVAPLGSPDPEGQCTCFEEGLTAEMAEDYLAVTDWEADASPELKALGVQCFPEIN